MPDSLRPHGLHNPWNSPGQNTGVGSHSLLQGIFPTQESNWGLLYCRQILYLLSYQGSPLGLSSTEGLRPEPRSSKGIDPMKKNQEALLVSAQMTMVTHKTQPDSEKQGLTAPCSTLSLWVLPAWVKKVGSFCPGKYRKAMVPRLCRSFLLNFSVVWHID